MSRNMDRAGLDQGFRLQLLEMDADRLEAAAAEDRAFNRAQLEDFRAATGRLTAVLVGILVSVATACILLAVNLAAK